MKKKMKKRSEWVKKSYKRVKKENICSVGSMRQTEEKFNEQTCIEILRLLSGDNRLEEMPHYDTLNYFEKLSPACLSDLRRKMINPF